MRVFRTRQTVRFQEVDPAGIVFYPRFYEYFHLTFEEFFGAETGVPYHVWIGERRIGWPAVHVETDFRAPLRYGDRFDVELSFPRVGRTSFACRYRIVADGSVRCTAEVTVVTSDLVRLEPIEIPAEVREALARHPGLEAA